jgi:F420-non-reducing hydrogenase iron-sulfur subunit
MDTTENRLNVAIFFCRQLDADQDLNRRSLEKELGSGIRFFPLPCSGRIESLHLMQALESGADKVYLVTCPAGACRYREGNVRAKKRLAFAQDLIEEIGLEKDRFELVVPALPPPKSIDTIARDLLAREVTLGPSPLRGTRQGAEKRTGKGYRQEGVKK